MNGQEVSGTSEHSVNNTKFGRVRMKIDEIYIYLHMPWLCKIIVGNK